jgi:hypothetical protein
MSGEYSTREKVKLALLTAVLVALVLGAAAWITFLLDVGGHLDCIKADDAATIERCKAD